MFLRREEGMPIVLALLNWQPTYWKFLKKKKIKGGLMTREKRSQA
jgi:hypothetical protein